MAVDVYFASARTDHHRSLIKKVEELFDRAGFAHLISRGDLVAVKVHFGERGNTAFLPPVFVRPVVEKIKGCGGKPFLTDSNTLYVGSRSNAVDHLCLAAEHGFGPDSAGAPTVIADGLTGRDYVELKIEGRHFKTIKIGSAVHHADALIVLTHFKGHGMTGFGGALKNIGMGLGCRSAKQMMHSDVKPRIDLERCTGCGRCTLWCSGGAIEVINKKALIDPEKCTGCGECRVSCKENAVSINWEGQPDVVQEKIVEYATGILQNKQGKFGLMNFLLNVSPDCDCWEFSDASIVPDIGVLASRDPVAIEQASVDLVNRAQGIEGTALNDPASPDKFKALYPGVDWSVQISYAEKIGLGLREYRLIKID